MSSDGRVGSIKKRHSIENNLAVLLMNGYLVIEVDEWFVSLLFGVECQTDSQNNGE